MPSGGRKNIRYFEHPIVISRQMTASDNMTSHGTGF
jgi:hypothetical protein